MASTKLSIRGKLTLFIVAFVAIILAMAVTGVVNFRSVDLKTQEIDQKWHPAAAMLAEIADRISEYRIAEGYRALASSPKERAQAEALAHEHRTEIEKLRNGYIALIGNHSRNTDLDSFNAAWTAYNNEHDSWVQAHTTEEAGLERHNQSLARLYKVADHAVDRLIATNTSEAHAQAKAVDRLTDESLSGAIAVSVLSLLLAAWIQTRIRSRITRPLEAITQALSKLAAGSRDVRVPELHRQDEIGAMAMAFEVFRTNALALEQAHKATRVAQEHAHSLARHDALTGLPNRRVFSGDLQAVLSRAQKGSTPCSVLLVGLDRFKQVNDLQGRPIGDMVLCEVARRLQEIAGKNGRVARLGGDEFAIIALSNLEQNTHFDRARDLAARVITALRIPIRAGECIVEVGASIGIAPCLGNSTDAEGLLHAADIAMYRAKLDGRGTFRFFEQSMDDELRAKRSLEADLKSAVLAGRIKPYYQPLVEIQNNRTCGFEVLARWDHPERGFVPPDVFIPIVERLGLIAQLTTSILTQACRDARHWPQDVRLAVNISPSELKDPLLPGRLLSILTNAGFAPARLEVEITETALVIDIATAKSILSQLRGSGMKVCLDDFGTGYSSLYHLRELKFDKVKIDRSFVQSMLNNPESEKIVDAILGLTKSLNLPTVAEGIEDLPVLLRLASKGCEYGQGYYFGRPMTAEAAGEMVTERTAIQKTIAAALRAA